MNDLENQLYEELKDNATKCDKLMDKIYRKELTSKELKLEYKNLKNSLKNRYSQIKRAGRPNGVSKEVYNTFLRSYEGAMAWGFTEPTNGNLERMCHSLEEASYKFTKFIER